MKQFCLIIFSFCGSCLSAQTLPDFDQIKMEKTSDYKPAEPFVLQTSNYLLSIPFKKENKDRLNALRFISKWMNGTPDFSFSFTDMAEKIGKENYDLIGLYMAAMAKYTLENKAAAKDTKQVKLNAIILLINYCENKDNGIRMSKQLKKLSEARSKGELEKSM
ncbi:hypothetical protein [Ferruginibacter sp.]|uniref:hypothetical protein n=1 Tax=Ferruginibacter sp. TaxID=1940288 RepID=UPI00265819E3|nr:hypothetical protein [Ferruginibacter sp.]